MFACTRKFSMKVKERLDFRLEFHATQVPAWDKLFVSLIPLDTGRVTGKTRKVSIRNGQCHWPDAVTESARLLVDIRTLLFDEKFYKFVVGKSLSRSGMLGEVIVNLADYVSAISPISVAFPLRFCYSGTVLHVSIQCLTPKCPSTPEWQRSLFRSEGTRSDDESDISGIISNRSHCRSVTISEKYNMGRYFSSTINAVEEGGGIQPLSPISSTTTSGTYQTDRKKSGSMLISYVSLSSASAVVTEQRTEKKSPEMPSRTLSCFKSPGRSKDMEYDLEETLLKLHNEAESWKNYAAAMHQEVKEQLANMKVECEIEKSSLVAERESLFTELERMKERKADIRETPVSSEEYSTIQRLKEDLAFEKQANTSLNLQLQKLKESNMELLLAVRDMEDSLDVKQSLNREVSSVYEDSQSILEGDEDITGSSSPPTDKRIDRIINLNYKEQAGASADQLLAPRCKVLVSGLLEDLEGVKVALYELIRHPEVSEVEEITLSLQSLVEASQTLVAYIQGDRESEEAVKKTVRLGSSGLKGMVLKKIADGIQELRDQKISEEEKVVCFLNKMAGSVSSWKDTAADAKILQLEMEKTDLEARLKAFYDQEEMRKRKIDQLEAQVWEFAKEVDYVQASNDKLETLLAEMEEEKQALQRQLRNTEQEEPDASTLQQLQERLVELEARQKTMEEERDAYLLERRVFESLARDLCEQVQGVLHKGKPESTEQIHRVDFISHVKQLRAAFSNLLKAREDSEEQLNKLQATCDSLQDTTIKEHGQVMATVASLDAEFGQLSKQSDQMLELFDHEIEVLVSRCEQEQKEKKSQDMLRFAVEESTCEIAYLRDEIRKLKAQNMALLQEKEFLDSQMLSGTGGTEEMTETLNRLEAELGSTAMEYNAKLESLTANCESSKARELQTSEKLDAATKEVEALKTELKLLQIELTNMKKKQAAFDMNPELKEQPGMEVEPKFQEEIEIKSELGMEVQPENRIWELEESKERVRELEASNQTLERELRQLTIDLQAERAHTLSLSGVNTEVKAQLEDIKAQLAHQLRSFEDQKAALEQEVLDAKADSNVAWQTMIQDKLQNEGTCKCDIMCQLSDASKSLENDLLEHKKETEIKLAFLAYQLDSSKQEACENVSCLETALKQCRTLKDALIEQVGYLKSKLHNSEEERAELQQENQSIERRLSEAADNVKRSMEERLTHLHQSLDAGLTSMDHTLESSARVSCSMELKLLEGILNCESAYEQSFDANRRQLESCSHAKLLLEEDTRLLRTQVQEKEFFNAKAKANCMELMHKNEKLEAEALKLRRENEMASKDILSLTEELQRLQRAVTLLEEHPINKMKAEMQQAECGTPKEIETKTEGIRTKPQVTPSAQDSKAVRRKWKQQQPVNEQDAELRARIALLEAECNSKTLQLNELVEKSREREAVLCDKIVHLELSKRQEETQQALDELKQCQRSKAELECEITRLGALLESEKALKTAECAQLRQENEELKCAFSKAKLQERSKENRDDEVRELHDMVTQKEEELASTRQEIQEREAFLWKKIEYLELANEQLATQQMDPGAEQLKKEVTRLQAQISELARREHDLTSKLSSHELLQLELLRLQEENEHLEKKILKFKEGSLWGDTLERLMYLETELAEALETNNMYKLQLQSIFSKQQNVEAAALHNLGDVDEVISSLVSFKKQTSFLEAELKEMQDRYLGMSMRFAEIQGEREELIMTVKALRANRGKERP